MDRIHQAVNSMTVLMLTALIVLLVLAAVHTWLGRGDDLSVYDHPVEPGGGERFGLAPGPSTGHQGVVAAFEARRPEIAGLSTGGMIRYVRDLLETFPDGKAFDCRFVPVDSGHVRGEWVLAPGADPSRRVLYLHGGAFFAGSPNSHRTITQRFSELAGAAVFSMDYRLKPEHRRRDAIEDCRRAYTWLQANGPEGPAAAERIILGGDSAGGNLALMLSAWSRDQGAARPHAVVAFSPLTDCTFSAPSIRENAATDTFVRPLFGSLLGIPRPLIRWIVLAMDRMHPADPALSPVQGDLSGLPPTLVQVSESEMLYDDARRYVNKARGAGSPAFLQSWPDLLHVWQLFYPEVPESGAAFRRVGEFLERVESELA